MLFKRKVKYETKYNKRGAIKTMAKRIYKDVISSNIINETANTTNNILFTLVLIYSIWCYCFHNRFKSLNKRF